MVPLAVLLLVLVLELWEVVFSVGAGDALVGVGTLLLVGAADVSLASDASMVSVTVLRIRVKSGEDVRIRGGAKLTDSIGRALPLNARSTSSGS